MANKKHLDILKQGVDVWNCWRLENPSEPIHLVKADLMGVNLCDANLSGADLHIANLRGADLRRAFIPRS